MMGVSSALDGRWKEVWEGRTATLSRSPFSRVERYVVVTGWNGVLPGLECDSSSRREYVRVTFLGFHSGEDEIELISLVDRSETGRCEEKGEWNIT